MSEAEEIRLMLLVLTADCELTPQSQAWELCLLARAGCAMREARAILD